MIFLKKYLFRFFLLTVILFTQACKKETTQIPKEETGYQYFPLQNGKILIYNITEISIDKASDINDTLQYQLKEEIDSCFLDDEQDSVWRITRYWRSTEADSWKVKSVWTAKRTALNAQQVEENHRYIKLVFPVKKGQEWDGNRYNNLDEETYTVSDISSETIENQQFDTVLTVVEKNENTLVSKKYKVEQYASGIGLIYRENTDLYSQDVVSGLPIEQRIERGSIFIQEIEEIKK